MMGPEQDYRAMKQLRFSAADGVGVVEFDRPGSAANLLDGQTLSELGEVLDELEQSPDLRGLLLVSAKPKIFVAGADLGMLAHATAADLASVIELGQLTFNRLADLRIPTAAAIHGACVGGGLELALACDWRVASDAAVTKLGLPETQLGILPAWGGTTRLPRLLGLSHALPLILSGKLLGAEAARRAGLVDGVAPAGAEPTLARQLLKRGNRKPESHPLQHNAAAVAVIRAKAGRELLEKTRGHYPGPEKALEVACEGILQDRAGSLEREKAAILELAGLPQTRQLLRLFFLRERSKKSTEHAAAGQPVRPVRHLGIVGAGIMGSGIAAWATGKGLEVTLLDRDWAPLAAGQKRVKELIQRAEKKRVFTPVQAARALDRVHLGTGDIPLTRCDLVLEAAVEDLAVKQAIFADLSRRTRPDTVLATNTSALPIRQLLGQVSQPQRVVGLHFFNPVHRMELVEVIRTDQTSAEALATALGFVRALGKLPVVVADSPGFLVNRILLPYLVEAARLFEQGADPEEIDEAMLDFGMPMGPLRLLDEVGLDVAGEVARTLAAAFPQRMVKPEILDRLLASGLTGRKGGGGFYQYPANTGDGAPRPHPQALALRRGTQSAPADVAAVLAGLMADEARLCLREGIARDADDIDLAMVLGTGYAPFRGGPMQAGARESG